MNDKVKTNSTKSKNDVSSFGKVIDNVDVNIGPRFLQLFSDRLYSSPNKAFEELISNSWDAGAKSVYVGIPETIIPESIIWILDDGESMDVQGMQLLWNVANSEKRVSTSKNGREQIGKFGIGKLSTYTIANELTYFCKAEDGIIRSVSIDYRVIDQENQSQLHINPIHLDVKQYQQDEFFELLEKVNLNNEIGNLIIKGIPSINREWIDEYGGKPIEFIPAVGTWTLVLLTSLKQAGLDLKTGWIKRLISTSLPLGSSIGISVNNEPIHSSKSDIDIISMWQLGKDLGISKIEVIVDDQGTIEEFLVLEKAEPYPHIEICGINGEISGFIKLTKDSISGGKSDELGYSNGFFINVFGRVLNNSDPYFGLDDLHHSTWSRFRATIKADFLDGELSVNREDITNGKEMRVFKALLMAIFNKARSAYNSSINSAWAEVGNILVNSWNVIPLDSLQKVIERGLESTSGLPSFIEIPTNVEIKEVKDHLESDLLVSQGNLIKDIEFVELSTMDPIDKYSISSQTIQINQNHPFCQENFENAEQKKLVKDTILVNLLTDSYMIDIGIHEENVRQIREYRDQMLRLIARINRKSGTQIASILTESTSHPKGLEIIVGDALEYLGFVVDRKGNSGEPEGIALAPLPLDITDSESDPEGKSSYTFTYDAKSTKNKKVKTGNVGVSGLKRHQENYKAKYSLVVGPEFQVADKLIEECSREKVTPIRAESLARLVLLTQFTGPIDLRKFEELFQLFTPNDVDIWIEKLHTDTTNRTKVLSLDMFLSAVADIGYKSPNKISLSLIAYKIGEKNSIEPKIIDVKNLALGLEMVLPHLFKVSIDNYITLSTTPDKIRIALRQQLEKVPPELSKSFIEYFKNV